MHEYFLVVFFCAQHDLSLNAAKIADKFRLIFLEIYKPYPAFFEREKKCYKVAWIVKNILYF